MQNRRWFAKNSEYKLIGEQGIPSTVHTKVGVEMVRARLGIIDGVNNTTEFDYTEMTGPNAKSDDESFRKWREALLKRTIFETHQKGTSHDAQLIRTLTKMKKTNRDVKMSASEQKTVFLALLANTQIQAQMRLLLQSVIAVEERTIPPLSPHMDLMMKQMAMLCSIQTEMTKKIGAVLENVEAKGIPNDFKMHARNILDMESWYRWDAGANTIVPVSWTATPIQTFKVNHQSNVDALCKSLAAMTTPKNG
jgi:hypothetical protein